MKVLLIDNYDSFTFNLAHALRAMPEVVLTIVKNDALHVPAVSEYDKVIISPGPGLPGDNGCILEVIRSYFARKPILGVCLGHQAIAQAFGGRLLNLPRVHHGVASMVQVLDRKDILFRDIATPFEAGRYHSWVCDPDYLPAPLRITAVDATGAIMACRHRDFPVHGIQFHPESILTPDGDKMLRNFIRL